MLLRSHRDAYAAATDLLSHPTSQTGTLLLEPLDLQKYFDDLFPISYMISQLRSSRNPLAALQADVHKERFDF
jgi:hypothetical protein